MYYWVYLVKCKSKKTKKVSYYCGYTNNPSRRANEHKNTKNCARYLRGKIFIELRVIKRFGTISSAMRYEKYVKKKLDQKEKIKLFNGPVYFRYT
jgi:predicted GIY-YIG superfamily endonuclease